ncbi:Phosphoglycerate mutase [Ruegeria sp. TM1040]|uniref:histidine phosphatase family protein n=1 Tax=Ruegeria sp. (strain TM1040) TaxID=292414 RepID=UPI00004626A3|nr:histidine phosphatase family protein [Ruegeria sp. TM1040]ABF63589.1 Phosphoglycerate mutase [Ruegeria sp. TM1040]
MKDFPKIWFLRHGQTEWNAERRVQGQLESDLTELGITHAHRQAELMTPILQAHQPPCFVSPLRRAQHTARIALSGRGYETEPALAEVHAGRFQGLTIDEIAAQFPQVDAQAMTHLDLFCAAPEGEGYASLHDRVLALLRRLEQPTVLVAHGLLGQVVRGLICGLERDEMAALPNEQGCVYVLEQGQETVLR